MPFFPYVAECHFRPALFVLWKTNEISFFSSSLFFNILHSLKKCFCVFQESQLYMFERTWGRVNYHFQFSVIAMPLNFSLFSTQSVQMASGGLECSAYVVWTTLMVLYGVQKGKKMTFIFGWTVPLKSFLRNKQPSHLHYKDSF